MNIASVRILRLASATAICMFVSQVFAWQMSFVAPVITMFILALPLPALKLSAGIKFVVVFVVALYAGLLLMPFIVHYSWVGFLLLALALFHSFYYTAKGGSPVIGALSTVGLAMVAGVGTVSIDAVLNVIHGLNIGVMVGVAFVWVGHAMLPDSLAEPLPQNAQAAVEQSAIDLNVARQSALRSLIVVLPLLAWFMLSSASASYVPAMIKIASMGQQISLDRSRDAARSLLVSTILGGIGAIVMWQLLSIWSSLVLYSLLIGLGGLLAGPRIFSGAGMTTSAATWSYAYLTMIVIIAPAVLDGQTGDSAEAAFWTRLFMFLGASLYGLVAVFLFDHFSSNGKTNDVRTGELAEQEPA